MQKHLRCSSTSRYRSVMIRRAFPVYLVALWLVLPVTAPAAERKIPCKIPTNAAACYWTHGRLLQANGTPSFRLWKIGTHRVLGIYSGPPLNRWGPDSEAPELPANIQSVFSKQWVVVYGDFEVCPLEEQRPETMQPACIEAVKNVVIKRD